MDNIMSMELRTPRDVQRELARRFKTRRLAKNLTQEGLAARSGVSWSSLKRFEHTGLIALDALLKLSLVLGCPHQRESEFPRNQARRTDHGLRPGAALYHPG